MGTSQGNRQFWNKFWSSDIIPKWKFFTWRLLNNALATNSNLLRRNIPVQVSCYLCKMHKENEIHLFQDCPISTRIWACSSLGIRIFSPSTPFGDWIRNFLKLFWKEDGVKSTRAKDSIATLWAIWLHRNNVVFRNLDEDPTSILERKDVLLKEFAESRHTQTIPSQALIIKQGFWFQLVHDNEKFASF